jgi:hypothetical protein
MQEVNLQDGQTKEIKILVISIEGYAHQKI